MPQQKHGRKKNARTQKETPGGAFLALFIVFQNVIQNHEWEKNNGYY
jgi:hypothetical protein